MPASAPRARRFTLFGLMGVALALVVAAVALTQAAPLSGVATTPQPTPQ